MNARIILGVLAVGLVLLRTATGQDFVNLDFELATVPPTPVHSFGGNVDPAIAFPGWTVGGLGHVTFYNSFSLGSPAVNLVGPAFPNAVALDPLQGSYSILFLYFSIYEPPMLSQTGMVPTDAKSISFLVASSYSDARVSLGGVDIPLVPIGGGRLAGDVTSFAGTTVQLTITTTSLPGSQGNWLYLDDVSFSPSPIPEPATMWLLGVGSLLLAWRSRLV